MAKKLDTLKLRLTIGAAIKFYDLLTKAIEQNDQRAIGAALHNLGRELQTLKQLAGAGDQEET